jgi:hypothetical protein
MAILTNWMACWSGCSETDGANRVFHVEHQNHRSSEDVASETEGPRPVVLQ